MFCTHLKNFCTLVNSSSSSSMKLLRGTSLRMGWAACTWQSPGNGDLEEGGGKFCSQRPCSFFCELFSQRNLFTLWGTECTFFEETERTFKNRIVRERQLSSLSRKEELGSLIHMLCAENILSRARIIPFCQIAEEWLPNLWKLVRKHQRNTSQTHRNTRKQQDSGHLPDPVFGREKYRWTEATYSYSTCAQIKAESWIMRTAEAIVCCKSLCRGGGESDLATAQKILIFFGCLHCQLLFRVTLITIYLSWWRNFTLRISMRSLSVNSYLFQWNS